MKLKNKRFVELTTFKLDLAFNFFLAGRIWAADFGFKSIKKKSYS